MKFFIIFTLMFCLVMPGLSESETPTVETALKQPQKLRIIADFQAPPFAYTEGINRVGFEVDMADAIAAELGMEVQWIKQRFNIPTMASTLDSGAADMVIASITVTPEREKRFIFSIPYFRSSLAAATMRDVDWNHQRWSNGLGPKVRVGVQRRTTAEEWVRKNLKATRKTYDSPARVVRALNSKDVLVAVMDEEILSNELTSRKYKFKFVEKGFDVQDYAIGFSKDNDALRTKVNNILRKLDQEGAYDRLYKKWFGNLADLPENIRPSRVEQETK